MTRKRQREQSSVDTQLVEIFEDLSNENENIRLRAAQRLLAKISPASHPSSEQLQKILIRLIKGLCSGRKAARLGFSVALTEFLACLFGPSKSVSVNDLTIPNLLDTLEKQTHVGGNVSGQEERDHYYGRLFGAEAIIKSAILLHPSVSLDYWEHVLEVLYGLAKAKPWLREECGWMIYQAVQDLAGRNTNPEYTQIIIDKLHSAGLSRTPEGVAIWLTVRSKFSPVKLPSKVWHSEDPLNKRDKQRLANILKEASTTDVGKNAQNGESLHKGLWTSRLHFAWDVVTAALLHSGEQQITATENRSKRLDFASFWSEAVDDGLFATTSSQERKYWGFMLFQKLLQEVPENLLHVLFSKNLIRCLINQLASQERYLHRVAKKTIKVLMTGSEAQPAVATIAFDGLTGPYGQIGFDQITKTKTIEKLISNVDNSGLLELLPTLRRSMLRPGTSDEKSAASQRQLIADLLVALVKSRRPSEESASEYSAYSENISSILYLLIKCAYFQIGAEKDPENIPQPEITTTSRDMFRSKVTSCLTYLVSKSTNPSWFPYLVVCNIRSREMDDDTCTTLLDTDSDIRKVIRRAWKTLDKVSLKEKKASELKKPELQAFNLVFCLTILQIYNGDADAVNVLDELKQCYKSLIKDTTNDKKGGSEALVEILLSFASKPSLLFRRLAEQVFSAFSATINSAGLQSMIEVLETDESISGRERVFDQEDDNQEQDIESDDNEGHSEPSDVEEIDMADAEPLNPLNHHHKKQSNLDNSSTNIDTDTSSNPSSPDPELQAFNAKLALALQTRSLEPGAASTTSSTSSMSSSQMEALDTHLSAIFRQRSKTISKKSDLKAAKETIANFKCRVLDLMEIYIKSQHSNILALQLLLPILKAMRKTSSSLVVSKATGVIQTYSRLCKGKALPHLSTSSISSALATLAKIHQEATLQGSNSHATACSQASLLIVKMLAACDRKMVGKVVDVYAETQKRMLSHKACKVKMGFFTDWMNWCGSVRGSIAV